MLEHPDITHALRTGYPRGSDPVDVRCPVCGCPAMYLYVNDDHEIVGCDECLTQIDAEAWKEKRQEDYRLKALERRKDV